MAASLLRRAASGRGRCPSPAESLRRLVSSEAAPEQALPRPLPEMPPFEHRPSPYAGMGGAEILEKRKKFLGPSLFYYYQKPVHTSYTYPLLLRHGDCPVQEDETCA